MKSHLLFKSRRGNRYVFDKKKKRTGLCHPILYYLLSLDDRGKKLEQWFEGLNGSSVTVQGVGPVTNKDIEYYLKKYLLLKKNGHFETCDQERRLSNRLTPVNVKEFLANVRQVTFETTEKCNLSCEYCGYGKFYNYKDIRQNITMDISTAKTILTYLQGSWNSALNRSHDQNIYISAYGGEPMLNFEFIRELVQFVKELELLHNRVTFSMTTNGLLLEKHMDFLVENDFNLLISLDGGESNNGYRVFKDGKPAYRTILENVKSLKVKYSGYFARRVNFNAVIHKKNSVAEVFNYFKRQFGKIPSVSALNTFGVREDQKETFWKTYLNINDGLYNSEDYSLIEKEMFINLPDIQQLSTFLHINSDCCFNNYNELLYSLDEKPRFPTGTCQPFSKKIFITAGGKIYPCERIDHRYVLGNADKNGVHIDFEEIARKYNRWYDKVVKQCEGCYNAEECAQCIFSLDLAAGDVSCKGFMNRQEYARRLSSHIDSIETNPLIYPKILKKVLIS